MGRSRATYKSGEKKSPKVKQGDVLVVVDTPELDQSIAAAQSEVAKANANFRPGEGDGGAVEFTALHGRGIPAGCRSRRMPAQRQGRPISRPLSRTSIG